MAFYSNNFEGRVLRLEVWQEGEYVHWSLFSEGGSVQYYTIYNLNISINGVAVYNPGTVSWNSYAFPAAKGNTGGRVHVGGSAGNRNIGVSFVGNVYSNQWVDRGGSITIGPTIWAPYLSGLSISSVTDKSVYGSFYVTDSRGQGPYSPYIDVGETNFGNVVKSIAARAGTLSGLIPNKTYYMRGNDANDGGRSYTGVSSFKTLYYNPGAPGKPSITFNKNEPIPTADYTIKWTAGSAGSTSVVGYRLRIFKNNIEVLSVDTESTTTQYTFNAATYGFEPGDSLRIGLYTYSKDWQGTKFFNGGGSGEAQVMSDSLSIVSDTFIKVSINGGDFIKYKMYLVTTGGLIEVKKEKLRVL